MTNKPSFKIGIDARMYGPKQTGIGTYIQHLINNLIQIDKDNEYFLFLLPEAFQQIGKLPSNFHKIKVSSHWYSFKEQTTFLKKLLSHNLDLVHFTHFNLPILYPHRFVVTVHDITPKFFPGHKMGKSLYRRLAYDFILSRGAKKSTFIITPSFKTKKDLISFYGADNNKVKVIYEGVKDKYPLETRREFLENYSQRKELALQNLKLKFHVKNIKTPFIFYVGVWRSHKNLPNLVRAFRILIDKYKFGGMLVLGGEEDIYYPETRKEWQNLGLSDKIIRPSFLSGEKLTSFYQAADVFVLPSLYEGFGLVTLEALNNGTAVACSNIEPLKEVLGDSALYFNPHNPSDIADKVWQLLQSKKLQLKLLANAQDILNCYDWATMAQKTHQLYLAALKKG